MLTTPGWAASSPLNAGWWNDTRRGLDERGFCNGLGEFSVEPLQVDAALYEHTCRDLPRLLTLARRWAHATGDSLRWARPDQRDLVAAYLDGPRRPVVARPDGIFVDGQLKLLELNIDSGVGGCFEVDYVQERFRLLLPDDRLHAPPVIPVLCELLRSLRQQCDERVFNLALITYPHFRPYHAALVHRLAETLDREVPGCRARVVLADDLRAGPQWMTDGERDYQFIWRFGALTHPPQAMAPVIAALAAARHTRTCVMSDPADLGVDGKLILASLSEAVDPGDTRAHTPALSQDERALIAAYVPWTRFVGPREVSFRGRGHELQALLEAERGLFVLKRSHSKSTEHVHLGAECSQADWSGLLGRAFEERGQWIAQENLRSPQLPFAYVDAQGAVASTPGSFTYNPFVFGERCAAPLIRIERNPMQRKVAMAVSSAMAITGTLVKAPPPSIS
ncbi:hypothetical protein CDN99_17870 [Roseateles aquatilis]|uniref:Glutathionylspermidine synthase pre-ATP-grasp-like domain-containing protein n=1 Tax=Roseateles aquatilis TaxID=431061 RepID=A0A246J4U6_9BURK|nr:hypothetical protein [Roseateles aquatilis]OWQ87472.1 hypothetical protein CDN99_17870 [Roseateles aquatilis]